LPTGGARPITALALARGQAPASTAAITCATVIGRNLLGGSQDFITPAGR